MYINLTSGIMKDLKVEIFKRDQIVGDTFFDLYVNGSFVCSKLDKDEALKEAQKVEKQFKEFGGMEKLELIYSNDTTK